MQFSQERELSSVLIHQNRLLELIKSLKSEVEKDNEGRTYNIDLKIEVIYKKDKKGFQTGNPIQFSENLDLEETIKNLTVRYYGHNLEFTLAFLGFANYFSVNSNQKPTLLKLCDDVSTASKNNSWNWLLSSAWTMMLFGLCVYILVTLALFNLITNFSNLDKDLYSPIIFAISALSAMFSLNISKLYPRLVIFDGQQSSGRILKKDWWFFLFSIFIPIVTIFL